MKRTYKFAVAISTVDFDALTAVELKRRLEQLLRNPVYLRPISTRGKARSAPPSAVRKTFEKDARVVAVLHQGLWGATPPTDVEAQAVRTRAATATGRKTTFVLSIDG